MTGSRREDLREGEDEYEDGGKRELRNEEWWCLLDDELEGRDSSYRREECEWRLDGERSTVTTLPLLLRAGT